MSTATIETKVYQAGPPIPDRWVLSWKTPIMSAPAFWYYDTEEEARKAESGMLMSHKPANEPQPATPTVTWCRTNNCEQATCHRCFPRVGCDDHEKCQEFNACGEAYTNENAQLMGQPATPEGEASAGVCPRCGGSQTSRPEGSRTLFCLDCQQVTWTFGVYNDAQPTTPHTATPWRVGDDPWLITDQSGRTLGSLLFCSSELSNEEAHANAALIVQAVNSHAALVTHLLTTNEVLGRCAAQFEMLHRPDLADECMAKAKANRKALALAGK